MKTYAEIRDWLENFIPQVWGKEELGLARIQELLKRLGNPERKFKSIHVAGTSGKGSTAFYTARLLEYSLIGKGKGEEASMVKGLGNRAESVKPNNLTIRPNRHPKPNPQPKIGLHVSPHLNYIGERMQINGEAIRERRLIRLIGEIKPVVEEIQREKLWLTPSYFEILVAASFLYFAQEKVDWAVVEVGLGGRLDATNVLQSRIAVITDIGLDHTEILGDTVEKIAWEKAGIVKERVSSVSRVSRVSRAVAGVPVVTAARGKALGVIKRVAAEKKAEVIEISNKYQFQISNFKLEHCTVETAGLAIKTVETLGFRVSNEQIKKAFGVGFPGRFEEVMPGVLLDGAHNPDKVKVLITWTTDYRLQTTAVDRRPWTVVLVLAFKKGKDWKTMIDLLVKDLPVEEVIATEFCAVTDTGAFAAVPASEIAEYVKSVYRLRTTVYSNSQEAVFRALQTTDYRLRTTVLVTGSLYLVGEVRPMFRV